MKTENPVVWFEIYVNDLNRARKFYETVFDLKMEEMPTPDIGEEMQMLFFPGNMESKNKASGALVKMKDVTPGSNSTLVYFKSEDCAIEAKRVENTGGKIVKPKTSLGDYGNMVLVSDTEGNMIGIHSMK